MQVKSIPTERSEQRKLVESLLGKGSLERLPANFNPREQSNSLSKHGEIDISILDNPRICKSFLVGKCPYDMLDNTKENMGRCPKLHIEKHKLIYKAARENNIKMPRNNYEIDYMHDLEKFVQECDKRVSIAEERLDYSESDKQLLYDLARKVEKLETIVNITVDELNIIQLEKSDIKRSVELNEKLRRYINEKEAVFERYSTTLEKLNTVGEQKLQVCKICAAYMSKIDNDKRLVDHFTGKVHLAYLDMRNTLDDLKSKYDNKL